MKILTARMLCEIARQKTERLKFERVEQTFQQHQSQTEQTKDAAAFATAGSR